MEANEAQELHEQAEEAAHDSAMRPVAFTMAVLAVLVALTTVLGHRTHTEAIIAQNTATDQWNEYQAHKSRSYETKLTDEILSALTVADKDKAAKIVKDHKDHLEKWDGETKEDQAKAEELQEEVHHAEARANRFDLAEALLEIGLVVTSVTLLTRSRIYWLFGMIFALAGVVSAASVLMLK